MKWMKFDKFEFKQDNNLLYLIKFQYLFVDDVCPKLIEEEKKFYDYMVEADWMTADTEIPRFEALSPTS